MPQEAWALKCYACKKFQVQLKKKAKKWQCKVCGAKQDLITIFFQGSPSDCRVNVQNMNAAEGEMLEKLQEQSMHQDESYNNIDDNYENCASNSQQNNYFSHFDEEEFTEEAAAEISEQCTQFESNYSQGDFITDNHNTYVSENNRQNYAETTETESCVTNDQLNVNSEDDYFDLNSVDCKIKIHKNEKMSNNEVKNHNKLKSSIFESNSEFDESLDF